MAEPSLIQREREILRALRSATSAYAAAEAQACEALDRERLAAKSMVDGVKLRTEEQLHQLQNARRRLAKHRVNFSPVKLEPIPESHGVDPSDELARRVSASVALMRMLADVGPKELKDYAAGFMVLVGLIVIAAGSP